jgi:putative transposase
LPYYRRNYQDGGAYFFTVVTFERRPILTSDLARRCLREAFQREVVAGGVRTFAVVLLPDHLHAVWLLAPGDRDFSRRWSRIKATFTRDYLASGGGEGPVTPSRERRRERAIWQRRFWEHTCRDEDDLRRCVDYLHWNPVKHGLVDRVGDYPWSSYHRFVREGEYVPGWGADDPCPDLDFEWE